MLYLSRKIGESIVINNSIELTVVEVRGKTVKIGFDFPPEATVLRKEIYDKILAENMAAATGGGDDADFMEGEFDLSLLDTPKAPK
ncbi:MAG: carbon storage regulator CsrA [Rickettsiales bacterium]